MKTKILSQEEMVVFKEYGTLNKGGKLFILMKDKDNNLYSLTKVDVTSHHHYYKKINSLTKPRKMFEPNAEDYNLFLKSC